MSRRSYPAMAVTPTVVHRTDVSRRDGCLSLHAMAARHAARHGRE
jgi:hypothetical protein